jgi:nucleoside-triphosphatase THEP1
MQDRDTYGLAAIRYARGFPVDALILGVCNELRARGVSVGGILQSSFGPDGQCAQSVLVTDLRSGEAFNIWDQRGSGARGCRLDERGLLDVEPAVRAAIREGTDLIVINRFGRAESLGRGLLDCFTAALEAGIPVLTAVRAPYDDAWRAFHGGLGAELTPEPNDLLAWVLTHAPERRAA